MNKFINALFISDKKFRQAIAVIARRQFNRRQKAYYAISIFDVGDLEQELWTRLFTSDIEDKKLLLVFAQRRAEDIATNGRRKWRKLQEYPIADFPRRSRDWLENLFYSSRYDLESDGY